MPGADGTANAVHRFRTDARYVTAEMTVNPRLHFHVPGTDGEYRLPGPDTKIVFIRLPHEPTATGTQLHAAFHQHQNLRDIRTVVTTCRYTQEDLQFGTLERDQFTQDVFNAWIEDKKQRTKYEIVAKLIRPAFVGDGILETPINRLVKCKQVTINERGTS